MTIIELFKNDVEFKKFLGHHLLEKLTKVPSIQIKELMMALMETLDVEGVGADMIRFALKTEMFYAFPVSYMISLLNKIATVKAKDEMNDFIKTI